MHRNRARRPVRERSQEWPCPFHRRQRDKKRGVFWLWRGRFCSDTLKHELERLVILGHGLFVSSPPDQLVTQTDMPSSTLLWPGLGQSPLCPAIRLLMRSCHMSSVALCTCNMHVNRYTHTLAKSVPPYQIRNCADPAQYLQAQAPLSPGRCGRSGCFHGFSG